MRILNFYAGLMPNVGIGIYIAHSLAPGREAGHITLNNKEHTMKTITALALALLLCAGLGTAAYAHGWHNRGNHGYHNGWNMRADGYGGGYHNGGGYRNEGPCWSDQGGPAWRDGDGRGYERREGYRDQQQRPDRGDRQNYGNGRNDMGR